MPDQGSGKSIPSPRGEFLVVCLCADWCGTCRDYRAGFEALGREFPDAQFLWVDIEDEDNDPQVADLDIDDFPTILIQRNEWVLFFGTMLPHHSHLQRTLAAFREQTPEQSRDYAYGNAERRAWQTSCNFRPALTRRHDAA